jgi:hypothetical protein
LPILQSNASSTSFSKERIQKERWQSTDLPLLQTKSDRRTNQPTTPNGPDGTKKIGVFRKSNFSDRHNAIVASGTKIIKHDDGIEPRGRFWNETTTQQPWLLQLLGSIVQHEVFSRHCQLESLYDGKRCFRIHGRHPRDVSAWQLDNNNKKGEEEQQR